MKYEGVWTEGVVRDLEKFTPSEVERIINKFETILDSPNTRTERMKMYPGNIRKIRYGMKDGEYRLLLAVDDQAETVYALAFKHHNQCYKENTKKYVVNAVKTMIATSSAASQELKDAFK